MPSAATVVAAITWPAAFLMVMVSPAVPVPSRTGRFTLVNLSVLLKPVSLADRLSRSQMDPVLLASPLSLGASRLYTFRRLPLPLIRPATGAAQKQWSR